MTFVIKRAGNREELDINKIRKVINWCIGDYELDASKLEAKLSIRFKDGITTSEIQQNVIQCALELCSPDEPDWRYVAGRLYLWDYRKHVCNLRGFEYGDLVGTLMYCGSVNKDYVSLNMYTREELNEAASYIEPDLDLDYDYAGAVALTSKYLNKGELPQEMYMITALVLASNEKVGDRIPYAVHFYKAVAQRKLSLATPLLANSRTNGSLSSCFITSIDDSLESIFDGVKDVARISKNGGGVGINVSKIRALHTEINGRAGASGGVVPWIKILNDTAIAVDQGGRRAGAVTVGLDIWHLDIEEFLEMQTEQGDQRRKAYDIFPQVIIPDLFMRLAKSGRMPWTLLCPYEVKKYYNVDLTELHGVEFLKEYTRVLNDIDNNDYPGRYKHVEAKDLLKKIMKVQLETGLPYLAFKDTINEANPNKHAGYIPQVNLCVESFSNVSPGTETHTCNLISLNLANVEDEEIAYYSSLAVRILDNTIDITKPPIASSKHHNNLYRTIGIGAMGLADYLAKNNLMYGTGDAIDRVDRLFEDIAFYTTHASVSLAKDRGAYPEFHGSEWWAGNMLGAKKKSFFETHSYDVSRWNELRKLIQEYGIRNSHITAIAPNTSSSLLQGCSASVLPVYSKFYYDKNSKGSTPIAPPYFNDKRWFYRENKTLDQINVINMVSTIQKWVDTGISMELLFNLNKDVYGEGRTFSAKDMYDLIIYAWEMECKAIYYIRSVQRDDFGKEACSMCTN